MVDRLPQGPFRNCMEWFDSVFPLFDPEEFSFLMVLLWNIWNRRNRWLHSNQLVPARLVSEYAQIVHGGFQQSNEDVVSQVACVRMKNWSKPEQGHIKINEDGAWKASTRTAAIGVIARDHHGLMIDGCARLLTGAHTAETAEACAFEAGLLMARDNGWDRVTIEGDALSIINRLWATELDNSVAASFLADSHDALHTHPGFVVQHVAREANQAAHGLARHCVNSLADFSFVFDVPECIAQVVIHDAIFSD
ncbi:hypothetical protein V6N11_049546 [Hibiscus sabdariffa]|uniref:RNase H type-1 domain-containing protein n=1 Tax=Hibiscus sabdariffa TaxID=183260 RepID=A0ABR2NN65_9ROSI